MSRVLIPLAEGCEELEAVTLIDILRRGEVDVTVAGLVPGPVIASRGVVLVPDVTLDEVLEDRFDMIVLPGGKGGAERLEADGRLRDLLRQHAEDAHYTAAICAAPRVLAAAGLLDHREATSFPGFLDDPPAEGLVLSEAPVVQDGNVITSRGPGTAMDFALELLALLRGKAVRDRVEGALQRP